MHISSNRVALKLYSKSKLWLCYKYEFHHCRYGIHFGTTKHVNVIVTNIIHIGKISSSVAEYSHIRWGWEHHFFFPKRQQQYCTSFEFMQSVSHFPLTALTQSSHGKYH